MIGTGGQLYGVGETYRGRFATYNASGALTNADSTPTGVLVVNGSDTAVTVTVANPSTGRYTVSCSLAGRSVGDDCWVRITATVGGVTQEGGMPGFRVAFPAALSGGILTSGTGTGQISPTSGKVPATLAAADVTGDLPADMQSVDGENTTPTKLRDLLLDAQTSGGLAAYLIAEQNAYAPAKAGDAMTLTGAYDAAKNAASQTSVDAVAANVTTLTNRLTAARAGYLDNLNVGGPVASHADVLAVNQSASKHLLLTTVQQYERPESGSTTYTVECRTFSASTGAATNADSTPTLTATGQTTGDLSANLSAATSPATGVYRWSYTVASNATVEPLRFDVSATIASSAFTLSCYTQVCDFVAATWTTSDRTDLQAIKSTVTTNLDAKVSTRMATFALPAHFSSMLIDANGLLSLAPGQEYDNAGSVQSVGDAVQIDLGQTNGAATLAVQLQRLDATVGSRMATFTYTAPDNAGIAAIQAKTDQLTFTTPNVVDASASVTLSTQDKQDISDAVVAGIGTVGGLTDEQAAQLTDSYNKLQSMGANVLNVVSPVAEDGTVTLYQGDDYLLADAGRPLEFTITDYAGPDLTGAAVTFKLARHGKYAIGSAAVSAELTVTSGTMAVAGSTVTIRVPLTSAQTAALTPTGDVAPNYQYHLVATTASGSVLTEAVGGCVVRKRIS